MEVLSPRCCGIAITHVELEISARLHPFEQTLERLEHITGVGQHTLEILFAEVGWNMDPFPDAAHLASWAGMCPGQHESAGRRLSGRVRKGNKWLRAALVQAAHAAARTQTYLGEQYCRLSKRRGSKRAAIAVGHSILVIYYHMMKTGEPYQERGVEYLKQMDKQRLQRHLLRVRSTKTPVQCPVCASSSVKVHSRYIRTPADLPCLEYAVRLQLQVRRFFCQNGNCPRKTFAEPFPALVETHARRTARQARLLREVAFALGGKAGAGLLGRLGIRVSRDTLLRLLRGSPLPDLPVPRVLGLDDWAWRKGHTYGTILCDLEQHVPVDLLPDRAASSVESWLKAHPGVEIISLDRAHDYAAGARRGAPHAVLIADRFHLTKNFGDALEPLLDRHQDLFRFGDRILS